ncbi:MAG TPA: hypothetical protein PKY50_13200 [Candidatus Competibacter sp.]|nr:hypothetical protein [Candidatus Competibacter sp.]
MTEEDAILESVAAAGVGAASKIVLTGGDCSTLAAVAGSIVADRVAGAAGACSIETLDEDAGAAFSLPGCSAASLAIGIRTRGSARKSHAAVTLPRMPRTQRPTATCFVAVSPAKRYCFGAIDKSIMRAIRLPFE